MIRIKNICKNFNNKKVIDNLSLEVKTGEVYGLLGANGAGKSTTLNLLLGFLKADSGSIELKGYSNDSGVNANNIGYINENVNLYPYLNGLENLDYFSKLAGQKFNKSQLTNILFKCGLQKNEINKRISTYSKGMRQKVGIAIAYAKKASIFLLDEPASGLDPVSSNDLSKLLKTMSQEGATILMASHDIFRVRETCHKIGILKNGRLIKEMYADEVSSKELEQLYIDYMAN